MAEILIPLLAMGLYVISNHGNNTNDTIEGFNTITGSPEVLLSEGQQVPPINYPVEKISQDNPYTYSNPNQTTDKFFSKNVYKSIEQNNPRDSVGGSTQTNMGLTGDAINKLDFQHNNMVPFFGSKIKGATSSADISQTQLDNMQGAGSQHKSKVEQAPLFSPQTDMAWSHGMPSTSEFIMSRQNPSLRMANSKPWDEEKVAPGLGQVYTTTGSNAGFNSGMEDREAWLPKTVDQLRVDTNPKTTYTLNGLQGPSTYFNKEASTINTQGKVEKNRPDTDYELGQTRWFTTTGAEKAPTIRSKEEIHHTNRQDTTETDYYGPGAKEGQGTYINTYSGNTHKQQLAGPALAVPNVKLASTVNDYGHGSYHAACNNRTTTRQPTEMGPLTSLIKAITAPIVDVLRPTKKDNVVGNIRTTGNARIAVSALPIYNPGDRVRTTIREQTEKGAQHINVQNQTGGGYKLAQYTSTPQERDTTNVHYTGSAVPTAPAQISHESVSNQRNNVNKTYINRPSQGGMSILNSNVNVSLRNDTSPQDSRSLAGSTAISTIPNTITYGSSNMPEYVNQTESLDRLNPDVLTAFKQNPFTHSLNSWA